MRPPKRSTLSYANQHRPSFLFRALFFKIMERFRARGSLGKKKGKFKFKNKLLSLDSSNITLCLGLLPWAEYKLAKGRIKAHIMRDHDDYMLSFVLFTEAKVADVTVAQGLALTPGSILVLDRGYQDYALFGKWTGQGISFVTRLKSNAVLEVMANRSEPKAQNVLADQTILLTGSLTDYLYPLRRLVVLDEKNQKQVVLLTNYHKLTASIVADIYKDRWEIELLFKALKQTLKVKTFVGTNSNALEIQNWTALIVLLLLKRLHHLSLAAWSLSNLAAMLRLNFFTYRELRAWLQHSYHTPPLMPEQAQLPCLP
ncbi:transposase [Desulfarculales bacterium]